MIKTTQKALKKHVTVGIAKDITQYSFEEADALHRAHSLETIAVSSGIYGSLIEPVPIMQRLRFERSAFSSSSRAFSLTSISSKACSMR